MIAGALLLQGLELTVWATLYHKVKQEATRQILTFGRPRPSKIPIVDDKMKDWAGHPTKPRAMAAQRVVGMARRLTNTKSFEYLILGLLNPKSKLHSKLLKKQTAVCAVLVQPIWRNHENHF